MSYDLQIWSAEPLKLPPATGRWAAEGAAWLRSAKSGATTVWNSTPAEAEDAPQGIAARVPDLAWYTGLSLHAFDEHPPSVTAFRKLAKQLAKAARGAVFDPQLEEEPSVEAKSSAAPRRQADGKVLAFSWWFGPQAIRDAEAADKLLKVFETHLPEALPRRYGTFEPPEFRYDAGGRPALARFLGGDKRDFILWYPSPPVVSVDVRLPDSCGASWRGYRTNALTVEVDAAMLDRPGWSDKLHMVWRSVSPVLLPFYGDVRVLGGYGRTAKRLVHHPRTTENHPVEGWSWGGIPATPPLAALLGPPYTLLWPGFTDAAESVGDLAFLDSLDWKKPEDLWARIGGLPPGLTDPFPQPTPGRVVWPLKRPYPPVWPFGEPYDESIR